MKKGFTLLELLIVIGILAILAAVVVVVLNPVQLLAQARDSQRVSDLASLNSALNLYMSDVSPLSYGIDTTCYASAAISLATCQARHSAKTLPAGGVTNVARTVNGGGWVPVNFSSISSGSPLPTLPADPTNNTTSLFYSYSTNTASSTFELNAVFESDKYAPMMTNAKDGGNNDSVYETGTQPGLDI